MNGLCMIILFYNLMFCFLNSETGIKFALLLMHKACSSNTDFKNPNPIV